MKPVPLLLPKTKLVLLLLPKMNMAILLLLPKTKMVVLAAGTKTKIALLLFPKMKMARPSCCRPMRPIRMDGLKCTSCQY